ncbi:MAG TPA: ABC transporter substrate-binding protein [Nitrolancea sp.]|nr:ABC transporter substrate-binding protein [Nitrolancea sp.]
MDERQDKPIQPSGGLDLDQRIRGMASVVRGARFPRRYFVLGGLASAAALLASCGGNSSSGNPTPTVNLSAPAPTNAPVVQTGTTAATSVGTTAAGSASPSAASTAAASAAATGTSAQTLGKLKLITDPYPKYSGTPVDSDLLTFIRSEDLSDLNPAALNSYTPYTLSYDPLVWIDEFSLDPKPWLATSWEVSTDGKTYTFKLRSDVNWQDGTPLTADDVAFSMVVYRDDPESGVARFFVLMTNDPVVVDPHTVKFPLSDMSGDWVLNASNQFILQKKQFNDYWNSGKGDKGAKTLKGYPYDSSMLVGTGQWQQTKYEPGSAPPNLQYTRNENYFQGKPHFKQLIFKEVDQAQDRLTAWLNNETDMLWPVTATDVDQVKNQDGLLYSANAVAFMCAWINFKNPKQAHADFFTNKAVRQALSVGIDRAGYADAVFRGFVDQTKIGSVAFPWAYDTDLKSPDYDQAKAQQRLADAGYKTDSSGKLMGSDGKPITLDAIVANTNQYPVDRIAVSVQEDFRKLGIDMQIDTLEAAALKARWQTTYDWDLFFYSRILFAGFSDYTYYRSGYDPKSNPQGRNFGFWSNADADKLLDEIIRQPDLTKQKDLLWQFQTVIADDMPAFWFGFPKDLILVKSNLQGYQPNAMWQYWDTWKLWRTS